MAEKKHLDALRGRIDAVDEQIQTLINQRAAVAASAARSKSRRFTLSVSVLTAIPVDPDSRRPGPSAARRPHATPGRQGETQNSPRLRSASARSQTTALAGCSVDG